jgi:hypothetical protein
MAWVAPTILVCDKTKVEEIVNLADYFSYSG